MKKIIFILLIYILLIPIGIKAETKYLYDVLKNEAESNGLAKEYTGEHHDSFTEEPTHKIYHWYATSGTAGNTKATEILDKNNVIFAGQCWQMIRTTDTGGVKMIYNGEVEDGKCLNTRGSHVGYLQNSESYKKILPSYYFGTDFDYNTVTNSFSLSGEITTGNINKGTYTCLKSNPTETCNILYLIEKKKSDNSYYVIMLSSNSKYSQIGATMYNTSSSSISDIGYMSNTRYDNNELKGSVESIFDYSTVSVSHWYADSVKWDSTTQKYELVDPYQISSTSEISNLVGKYTFGDTNQNHSNSTVRYIASYSNTTYYYINFSQNRDLTYYNHTYTYGDSYTKNIDGTYTINNPTTFSRVDWLSHYDKVKNKYICKDAINDTCDDLWYKSGRTIPTYIPYRKISESFIFSNGFTYENGIYKLNEDTIVFFEDNEENIRKIGSHRYTCLNDSNECSTIYYVTQVESHMNYYKISDGKKIEDVVNELLYNEDVNQNNSTIKLAIDSWYKKYISNYTDQIEDSIFCNDRDISNYQTSYLNPNNTSSSENISYNRSTSLKCDRTTDQFSISNSKAKLIYPVGLPSFAEMNLLGNNNLRKNGNYYWLGTPYNSTITQQRMMMIQSNGTSNFGDTIQAISGIRPIISLKPNTMIISGDGSMENPYNTEWTQKYKINVSLKNETQDVDISLEDFSRVAPGKEVTFKITPIDGYRLNGIQVVDDNNNEVPFTETEAENQYKLTMPASNVTIIPSYVRNKFTINVQIKNETQKLDIMVDNVSKVLEGELVSFKVTPIEGYQVNEIQIIDSNNHEINYEETLNNDEYIFTMPSSDITIIPTYKKVSNSILIDENEHTEEIRIQVNDITMVVYEEEVVFTVIPEKGYEVVNIEIKDEKDNEIEYEQTENEHEYRFVMPSTNVTIKPIYQKKSSSINTDENEFTKEIIIEVNDATAVVYENQVRFTVVPEEGYEVESILIVDEEENQIEYQTTSTKNEYTFIMPATNVLITPVYKRIDNSIELGNPKTSNPKKNLWIISTLVILFLIYISKKRRKECK